MHRGCRSTVANWMKAAWDFAASFAGACGPCAKSTTVADPTARITPPNTRRPARPRDRLSESMGMDLRLMAGDGRKSAKRQPTHSAQSTPVVPKKVRVGLSQDPPHQH